MLRKRYSELIKLFVKHNNFKSEDEFVGLLCTFICGDFSDTEDGELVYSDENDEKDNDNDDAFAEDIDDEVEYDEYEMDFGEVNEL